MKKLTVNLLVSAALGLSVTAMSGCAVTTAGVKKGDERNFVRSLNDVNAGRAIKARMTRAADFKLKHVDVEVAEGIVVLSGNVPDQATKIEAERIAWSAPRVDEVGNEIQIKNGRSFVRSTKDSVLTSSVKTRLLADKSVKGRNINVESHDGIVYLLGVARTPQELERAARIASTTSGAREVVSYMKLADNAPNTPVGYSAPAVPTPNYDTGSYQPLVAPQNYQSYTAPQAPAASAEIGSAQAGSANSGQPQYRALPQGLSATPSAPALGPQTPYYIDPATGAKLPVPDNAIPLGPTAPAKIGDMGDQLGKAFPTDDALGAYRGGAAGEAVSIIESEPFYIDPETGKEIPVSFIQGR
ncbi:BON domain-containing protein [Fretibacter rubidus]|uniref:BON domain-containing protein n=1 Tax=Fretibacter rubidus TaxID=570162 RepID=UPI00352AA7F0